MGAQVSQYRCKRCAWLNTWMHYGTADNCAYRCTRCGTPHTLPSGDAIGPECMPLDRVASGADVRVSPWFSGEYQPTRAGVYEVVFTVSPLGVRLEWRAGYWRWGLMRVSLRQLMKWRGYWPQ